VSRRRSTLKAIDIFYVLRTSVCTLLEQPLIAGGNHTPLVGKSDGRITGISALHVSVILPSLLNLVVIVHTVQTRL